MLDTAIQRALETAVEDDRIEEICQRQSDIFTDAQIFELEMRHIFEGNWIYLAHESQMAEGNGYFRTYIGRQLAVIARTRNGKLNAFLSAFGQRSAELIRVARFESYRGFLFGSLSSEVAPLADHLGEAASIIDLIVDQSPEGLEVVSGALTCSYGGNWKLQTKSGGDAWARQSSRLRCFANGHVMLSGSCWTNPPDRCSRSLCLYPNLLLTNQQIRRYLPIAADLTEVAIHSIAPKGESTAARIWRLRQYEEDFGNLSGTPQMDGVSFAIQHRYWREEMRRALSSERRI
jgi:benzoate/toluate 1,2-dioxygenase alpha subunit